jgi:hypothetical protein
MIKEWTEVKYFKEGVPEARLGKSRVRKGWSVKLKGGEDDVLSRREQVGRIDPRRSPETQNPKQQSKLGGPSRFSSPFNFRQRELRGIKLIGDVSVQQAVAEGSRIFLQSSAWPLWLLIEESRWQWGWPKSHLSERPIPDITSLANLQGPWRPSLRSGLKTGLRAGKSSPVPRKRKLSPVVACIAVEAPGPSLPATFDGATK